jgi:hypothetical protein
MVVETRRLTAKGNDEEEEGLFLGHAVQDLEWDQ